MSESRLMAHVFLCLQRTGKMKVNEPGRHELESQSSQQMEKYLKLYSDLLKT